MTTPSLCTDAPGFVAAATSPAAPATGEEAGVFATLLEELQPALEAALAGPLPTTEAPALDATVPPEAVLQGVPLPTLLPLHVPLPADAAAAGTAAAVPAVAAVAGAAVPLVLAAPVDATAPAAPGAPAVPAAVPAGAAPVPGAPVAEPVAEHAAAAPAAVAPSAAVADQAGAAAEAAAPAAGPPLGTPDLVTATRAATPGEVTATTDTAASADAAPEPAAVDAEPVPAAPAPTAAAAGTAQPETVGPQAEQVTAQATSAAAGPAEAPAPAAEASVRAVQPAVAELARGLKSATPGHASLVVRLDPPELGAVLVRVQVRGGEVSVSCTTPDIGAVQALAFQKADVMELLRNEGLDLASFEVRQPSTSMDGRREQGEAQTGEAMQRERERGREASRPDTTADEQSTTPDDAAARGTWL